MIDPGTQKSGTEALSVFMNAHPQLRSEVNEVGFFKYTER